MEQLARVKTQQLARFKQLAVEVGQASRSVLFSQVWTSFEGPDEPRDANPIKLWVQAQSALTRANQSVQTYAKLSAACGIRAGAMDLLGDCHNKGATRLIEDLEHADVKQHPRDKLPGQRVPACSAVFLPIFDPSDPFARRCGSVEVLPSAVLEVLVCKSAQMVYNHSDLINAICEVMDKYKLGVSTDATAFQKWSKHLAASGVRGSPKGPLTPKVSPRSSMSRTSSMRLLSSDGSDETLPDCGYNHLGKQPPKSQPPLVMAPLPEASWFGTGPLPVWQQQPQRVPQLNHLAPQRI